MHEVPLPGVDCLLHEYHGPRIEAILSVICSVICFNKEVVSGEEASLELDGGGSVGGAAEEDGGMEEGCGCGGTD